MGLVAKGLQKHFERFARQLLPVALARINDKSTLPGQGHGVAGHDCPIDCGTVLATWKWKLEQFKSKAFGST